MVKLVYLGKGNIFGDLYTGEKENNKIIIYCDGIPGLPKRKEEEILPIQKKGFDVIIPEYYGYCRSRGTFTPENCIKTITDTIDFILKGLIYDAFENKKINLKYKSISIIGHSFGGWVACMIPFKKFNISNIGLFSPLLDINSLGQIKHKEEKKERIMYMLSFVYKKVYRIKNIDIWKKYFYSDEYSIVIDNNLKNINIFLSHGKSDEVIRSGRSLKFYKSIKSECNKIEFKEYLGLKHSGDFIYQSIKDFSNRI